MDNPLLYLTISIAYSESLITIQTLRSWAIPKWHLFHLKTTNNNHQRRCHNVKIKNKFHSPVAGTALASGWLPYSIQNLEPHLQDSPAAAANIPATSTLQIHSITFFAIWRADATGHSKNQHQNRNQSFQCGSTNYLEQSSSKCQGRCHTRNISVTFEDTLFLVGIQHLVTWLRAHDLALAHLRRVINLCTYLLTYLLIKCFIFVRCTCLAGYFLCNHCNWIFMQPDMFMAHSYVDSIYLTKQPNFVIQFSIISMHPVYNV